MKQYGIYLCYPPGVDLRKEGLGRYLAAFVKGTMQRNDVNFVILCPSWMKKDLQQLFESENILFSDVVIFCPKQTPFIARAFKSVTYLLRLVKNYLKKTAAFFSFLITRTFESVNYFRRLIRNHLKKNTSDLFFQQVSSLNGKINFIKKYLFMNFALGVFILLGIFSSYTILFYPVIITTFLGILGIGFKKSLRSFFKRTLEKALNYKETFQLFVYQKVFLPETQKMLKISQKMNVDAWYCTTAFWNSFIDISEPKLLCVPDVLLSEFPLQFAKIGGERYKSVFLQIKKNILKHQYFVTYSDHIKNETLVKHFRAMPNKVFVVRHAPNRLDQVPEFAGIINDPKKFEQTAKLFFKNILQRHENPYVRELSTDFQFLFYASQVRPNKNILSLLKAYHFLLKERALSHKLVLTGAPNDELMSFINQYHLQHNVLFLTRLSLQELAACYGLADLAVNPSLSEGGCPFTFTEALSLNTPVVMGKIRVAEEVLTDPQLQEATFFDPYNWRSIADKIEWALAHRSDLLSLQLKTYRKLVERSWQDVVTEHVIALDTIAKQVRKKEAHEYA